ncbi:MAG: hypothetical protein JWO43_558 [Candidatus Adlerbacteria bacterium]|nr:hypothetical protein [Candidatus Adlerbacteria bacterium]
MPYSVYKAERVGIEPKGMRWGLWPFYFEQYVSDQEPDMSLSDPEGQAQARLVMWLRPTRTDRPSGWLHMGWRYTRIETYSDITNSQYWKSWSKTTRQARKRWLNDVAGKTHIVRIATYEEYERGYTESVVAKRTKGDSIYMARQLEQYTPDTMTYWIAECMEDKTIKAGIAITSSPSTSNAYYAAAYLHQDSGDYPLMIGLFDEWYKTATAQGYKYLHLGEIWTPGKPKSWKGFSVFKLKFGVICIAYRPVLVRFVWGRLF